MNRIVCIIPSRLGVGEEFVVKLKLLGEVRPVPWGCFAWSLGGRYDGPFNRNARGFQYCDDVLAEWAGTLTLEGGGALDGPGEIVFDGRNQGAWTGDRRPIRMVGGYRWKTPGFHFLRVVDARSGLAATSNPTFVTAAAPTEHLYWGDPHCHTIVSDGLRCPEELYAFARDEAFLDFGALTDHVEAATDRQWEYMVGVTNDFNRPGQFATLVGQEWTDWTDRHYGHRNIYYPGDSGPVLRSIEPRYDRPEKLWKALDGREALVIPHHPANTRMGVDWDREFNGRFQKAVEIYSEWGNSECPATAGNIHPIKHCDGEKNGQHVIDALRRGYRLGFVGGGDVHDGRPGGVRGYYEPELMRECYPMGVTAVAAPSLTRRNIYDAIGAHRSYATTSSRIYLDLQQEDRAGGWHLVVRAASEQGIREAMIIRNGTEADRLTPSEEPRVVERTLRLEPLGPTEFCYVRVRTQRDEFAWSSPLWGRPRAR